VRRLHEEIDAEVIAWQDRNADERTSIVKQLQRIETEHRKLLDAYYRGLNRADLVGGAGIEPATSSV
jgi:hypothetical protein